MRVRLLGRLDVDGASERDLGSRKGRTLLRVLALARGAPVPVEHIADVLWADRPPSRPADQVGVLVSRLRSVLGPDRLVRSDAGYALLVDWLDVDEVGALVAEAPAAQRAGRTGAARAAAEAALALAAGPLAPEEEGPWIEPDRAALAAAVARAGVVAAEAALAAGDADSAVVAASGALARDPYDEAALRALMRAHAASDRPASALAAYAEVRTRLAEDLGVYPSPPTEEVHDEVLLGRPVTDHGVSVAGVGATRTGGGIIGRDAEVARLLGDLRAVAAGGASLVVVEGEAGIGKTAVVETVTALARGDPAHEREPVVLTGRCDELGRDLPLQPVVDAVAGPAAAAGLDLPGEGTTSQVAMHLDVDAGRSRLFASLLDVIGRIAGGRPTLLVVEDVHHAGPSTLGWLAFARRRGDRLLIVATTRPPSPVLPEADRLALAPLAPEAAEELAGPGASDEVLTRAGGNPLFLLALAGASGTDPSSITDTVAAHVDGLGAEVAAVVRAAAVLGPDIDLDLTAAVLRLAAVDVLGHLETAARAGLLDERASGYAFHHTLVREALEATTSGARRAHLHREAARALDGRSPADDLAVAVHARMGGDHQRAVGALVRAAVAAAARFDVEAALRHLDDALALGPTAGAHATRARVRLASLDYDGATDDATAAVALRSDASTLETAAWVAYYRRRFGEALAFADAAVDRAGPDVVLRTSALAVAGRVRHGRGDLRGAGERLAAARGAAPAVQGMADIWLAQVRTHEGRPDEALIAVDRGLVDAAHLDHPFAAMHGRFARSMALGHLGRLSEARRATAALAQAARDAGLAGVRFSTIANNIDGWLHRGAGRWGEAIESHQRALEATTGAEGSGPSGEVLAEPHHVAVLDLAEVHLATGDAAAAAGLEPRLAAIDTWEGTMAWHQRHRLGLVRARLALADGDLALAGDLAEEVRTDAGSRGARRYELLAVAVRALTDEPGRPGDGIDEAIGGLSRCAALEAWWMIAALAAHHGVPAWRVLAGQAATRLLGAATDADARALRRHVDQVLGEAR